MQSNNPNDACYNEPVSSEKEREFGYTCDEDEEDPQLIQPPTEYIMDKYREIGQLLFNVPNGATCQLFVADDNNYNSSNVSPTSLYVHSWMLNSKSPVLDSLLASLPFSPSLDGDVQIPTLTVRVPCAQTFLPLIKWLYTYDTESWVDSFTPETVQNTLANIDFLQLDEFPRTLCRDYMDFLSSQNDVSDK